MIMKPLILIIDDDIKLNRLVQEYLNQFGYRTLFATHPGEGLDIIKKKSPDLIILDIMLPEMDGFEVCKKIRQSSLIPIIMLTARGDVTDRVVGLELGADDYLAKPFEPRELAARIQSVLRRAGDRPKNDSQAYQVYGPLRIHFLKRIAELNGQDISLTTNEFAVLSLLVKNANHVLDRDQILDELRGMECDAFNRTVDITISRIRLKLKDDPKNPEFIKTVWNAGYVFIGEKDSTCTNDK